MKQTRKGSLTTKLTLIMAAIVFAVIVSICVFNTVFLEKFYINNTKKKLTRAFDTVSSMYEGGNTIEDTLGREIQRISNLYGINTFILDTKWNIIYATQSKGENIKWFQDLLFNKDLIVETLEDNEKFTLIMGYDPASAMNYLEIFRTFDNGNQIFMHVTVESLKENVRIFNGFTIVIGAIILVVSMVVVYLVSRKFVKPVNELSNIALRMSKLDFDVAYTGDDRGEIGLLGKSINTMSESLKDNIMKLQRDLEARRDFAANVSHELKTPIALIEGYAEGLKESVNDDAESREYYCDVIIDEAFKMDRLVKSLLELSELEQGHVHFEPEEFDIGECVRGIVRNSEIILKKKEISVELDFDGEYPVYFDPLVFENVFGNFFFNALNHCDGEKIIKILIERKTGYIVSVHNTGKNIPDEDLDRIWEKFYKVDKAHTREYGGNGIGLSVVKAILNHLKLAYGVQNTGTGVLFWFQVDKRN